MKIKELETLMGQVAPSEPVNISLDEEKRMWAVPFKGVFIGLSWSTKVPPLWRLERIKLVEGELMLVFEDGTCIGQPSVFCVGTLEEVEASLRTSSVDLAERFGEVVEGLDWPKYQKILRARRAVTEAARTYRQVVLEQGVVVDYQDPCDGYDQTLSFKGEGLPTWYEG